MTTTHEQLLERASQLVPSLGERAAEAEKARRLPPETLREVEDLDLWRLVVPTSLGGHGCGLATLAHSTRILAAGCMASAWTISFLQLHNWLLTKFPERARAELFTPQRPWAFAPAPLAPTGTLTAVDGGFVLSGQWEWATGVHHADWVMVHAVQAEPEFTTRFALVPAADVVIDDVWHTSGMCATGSDNVRIEEVFVPDHRTVMRSEMMSGGSPNDDGIGTLPVAPVLALVASAPALGGAEAAVDLYRERIAERVLAYSLGDKAIDQPAARMRLGSVVSDLAAARARWDAAVAELDGYSGTDEISVERRMAFRLTAAATVRAARSIVATIAEGAGASVYFSSSPFQRIQRDLEVLKGHVIFDWDRTTELAGRVALGLPLAPTDMV